MDAEQKQELVGAMMVIIKKEGLPIPTGIKIMQPVYGVKKSIGRCIYSKLKDEYRITVTTTRAKWVPCEKGKYYNKQTGQHFKRVVGVDAPIGDTINTCAHEIAHLKFWNHGPQHKSYTNHLYELLKIELGYPKGETQ